MKDRQWQKLLARLAPAPYTRSRNLAFWALTSAGELLAVAARYAEDADRESLLSAIRNVAAARQALELTTGMGRRVR